MLKLIIWLDLMTAVLLCLMRNRVLCRPTFLPVLAPLSAVWSVLCGAELSGVAVICDCFYRGVVRGEDPPRSVAGERERESGPGGESAGRGGK